MNNNFFLLCKSYSGDYLRVINLWRSVLKHNKDKIHFYLCIPEVDYDFFNEKFMCEGDSSITLIKDEDIIEKLGRSYLELYKKTDGRLSQQIVKSQFWKLFPEPINYLCLDSESVFTHDFYISDFVNVDGSPYTVLHENKDFLEFALSKNKTKVVENYNADSIRMMSLFGRKGRIYDFGPTPVIWSSKVWESLEKYYLIPRGISFWDAIIANPSELRWYGESLLAYKAIDLYPIGPLMKVYHYDWQFFSEMNFYGDASGSTYLGYLKQSNWDFSLDYGDQAKRKSYLSRMWRCFKFYFLKLFS
ncbi:DUF6492 family protein [Polynucleobacter victoriensis]|uniref:DUF6492 family protein n=1 Tax=Polynucleobacter victoriensis TaxID=2049319 RepID=UPI001055697A|nr:DUF6492 family protein [Polynucleobacter victoriensis]